MSKRIIYTQENGLIALVSLAPEATIADCIPPNTPYLEIDESELPDTTTLIDYFDALTINFSLSAIDIDLSKAREVTKDILRVQREPLFQKNDLQLRDAIISGNKTEIDLYVKERDRLRDITTIVDKISSFSELKALRLV